MLASTSPPSCMSASRLIAAQFNYNTALFDRSTIEALADDFDALLHQVLADPDQRLLAFALPERVAVSAVDGLQGDAARRRNPRLPTRRQPLRLSP